MSTVGQSRNVRKVVLISILIWLAGLVFYWLMETNYESELHILAGITLSYLVLWGVAFMWIDVSKTEMAHRFLLTSASLALTVGLLEVLVLTRIIDFRLAFGTPVTQPWAHPGNLLDPKLLHIHKPHDHVRWWGVNYRYDQHGLRNESDFETADVIVIGDSFIEGLGVPAADLLTSHLAEKLACTVVNLGQSWYGPQQELELLARYGLPLGPKVCVWTFFEGNDLHDIPRYNEATKDWENFSSRLHSFTERSFTKNALLAVDRVLNLAKHRGTAEEFGPKNISGLFKKPSGEKIRLYFWYKGQHLSANDYKALEELRSILNRAYTLCRVWGAKFLIVLAPTKFRTYKAFTEFDPYAKPQYWVINDLPKRLEAMVRDGMPEAEFLDLTPVFAEEAKNGPLLFLPHDSHWSREGHRVAATAIANFLKQWEKSGVYMMHH